MPVFLRVPFTVFLTVDPSAEFSHCSDPPNDISHPNEFFLELLDVSIDLPT